MTFIGSSEYQSSGGKDIVLNGKYSPEAEAKLLFILKKLCEKDWTVFSVRMVNKNSCPKLYEIKKDSIRVFYFIYNDTIYIPHITEHKQKNKTEANDKSTATNRIKPMLEVSDEHVAWLN